MIVMGLCVEVLKMGSMTMVLGVFRTREVLKSGVSLSGSR